MDADDVFIRWVWAQGALDPKRRESVLGQEDMPLDTVAIFAASNLKNRASDCAGTFAITVFLGTSHQRKDIVAM